ERLQSLVFESLEPSQLQKRGQPPLGPVWAMLSPKATTPNNVAPAPPSAGPGEAGPRPSAAPNASNSNAVNRQSAFTNFANRLVARRVGQSYVIEVSFASPDPMLSARVANATVSAYLFQSLRSKLNAATNGAELLQGRLDALS